MGVTMHAKSDSEVTSTDAASTPPRSPRRPLYYVQSPSQHDLIDKMSYGSSPFGSPHHHFYHCSPIHHSRESSTSRFSASLKTTSAPDRLRWKRLHKSSLDLDTADGDDDDDGGDEEDGVVLGSGTHQGHARFYVFSFVFFFVLLFTIFSLILWAASVPYDPKIVVEKMVLESLGIQAGMDRTGVPTDMLSLNSTVKIFYRNPATFFGVHVTSTPLKLHYSDLNVASGQIKKFYQRRKSQRVIAAVVEAHQVPLYGGVPALNGVHGHIESVSMPVKLSFVMRSRAYILGHLVKPKFYTTILCEVKLKGKRIGKPINMTHSCVYQ